MDIDYEQILYEQGFIQATRRVKGSLDRQTDKSIFRELSGLH